MISRYSALIFDMDGTLLDSMPYWRGQNVNFLAARGLPVPEAMRGRETRFTGRQAAELYLRTYDLGMTAEQILEECERAMLVAYESRVPEKPGARNFLYQAQRKGYAMCVATATPAENARRALAKQGMCAHLRFVVSEGEIGVPKRDGEFFRRVASRLGVPCEKCLVFEDMPYAAKAAKEAGCGVYAIADPISQEDRSEITKLADRFFIHYDELLEEL